jgi:hypothetical protein
MQPDEIDRILNVEERIVPSFGFAASVMDAVGREATAPPPIGFPWARAVPGIAAAMVALVVACVWSVREILQTGDASQFPTESTRWLSEILRVATNPTVAWCAFTVVMTYLAVKFSARMSASRR